MSLKAVVFDLDGVYFLRGTEKFLDSVADRFDVSRDTVEKLYKTSDPKMKQYKLGEVSGDEYWSYFISELEILIDKRGLLDLLVEGYEINQPAEDFRKEIAAKGVKACICSNNFAERIEFLDKRFNFLSKFDVQIFSYREHVLKPDRKIFGALIKKAGVSPEEIFFADDQEKNLGKANNLGINTALYKDFSGFKKQILKLL